MLKTKIIGGILATVLTVSCISVISFNKANFSKITPYVNSSKIAMTEANNLIQDLESSNSTLTNQNKNDVSKISNQQKSISKQNITINTLTKKLKDLKKEKPTALPIYTLDKSIVTAYNSIKFNMLELKYRDLPFKMAENYYLAESYNNCANYWREKLYNPPSSWTQHDINLATDYYSKYHNLMLKHENTLMEDIYIAQKHTRNNTVSPYYQSQINNMTLSNITPAQAYIYQDIMSNISLKQTRLMIETSNSKALILANQFAFNYWSSMLNYYSIYGTRHEWNKTYNFSFIYANRVQNWEYHLDTVFNRF